MWQPGRNTQKGIVNIDIRWS